jgi:hypothetical protein
MPNIAPVKTICGKVIGKKVEWPIPDLLTQEGFGRTRVQGTQICY